MRIKILKRVERKEEINILFSQAKAKQLSQKKIAAKKDMLFEK